MPRVPRYKTVDESSVGSYHCINRCVRRAFLCGRDQVTGKSYEHRRKWIEDRMAFLAGVYLIDVQGFVVMVK